MIFVKLSGNTNNSFKLDKPKMTKRIILLLLLCNGIAAIAQHNVYKPVKISGKVIDSDNPSLQFYNLLVVNKTTAEGVFGNQNGEFVIYARISDTIMVNSVGYNTIKFCLRDSAPQPEYAVQLVLKKISVELRSVTILSPRDLNEIQRDIEKLGVKKDEAILEGVNAFESPITALYQMFSRRERSRKLVAELENEARMRSLLKELLTKYVEADIISLHDDAFDDFIDFCAVSDEMIKRSSQYDFAMYIKSRYQVYDKYGSGRRY